MITKATRPDTRSWSYPSCCRVSNFSFFLFRCVPSKYDSWREKFNSLALSHSLLSLFLCKKIGREFKRGALQSQSSWREIREAVRRRQEAFHQVCPVRGGINSLPKRILISSICQFWESLYNRDLMPPILNSFFAFADYPIFNYVFFSLSGAHCVPTLCATSYSSGWRQVAF